MTMQTSETKQGKTHNQPHVEWQLVMSDTHEATGITIRVSRLPLGVPKYSVSIGRRADDGRIQSHFHVSRERSMTDVRFEHDYSHVVRSLMAKAEDFISASMRTDLSNYLEMRRIREEEDANRGKPKTRITGKTAKSRERRQSQD